MSFEILKERIRSCKTPLALHISPDAALLSQGVVNNFRSLFGDVPQTTCEAMRMYCCALLDAAEGELPAVVIDTAPFLKLGFSGLEVLTHLLTVARNKGLYTILNAGSTDAQPWFDGFLPDAVTVTPYTGMDAMRPASEAQDIFVMLKSANPSASDVQNLMAGDRKLSAAVAELTTRAQKGAQGSVGALIGSDSPLDIRDLRRRMGKTFFLLTDCTVETASCAANEYGADILLTMRVEQHTDGDFRAAARDAVIAAKAETKKYITIV
ncbi:MAG: hypothetical protein IJF15_03515 [Oscillospiraceae bacterium]|nr:hypothetical protein [Oscillospiraceae bacterium]